VTKDRTKEFNNNKKVSSFQSNSQRVGSSLCLSAMLPLGITRFSFNIFMPLFKNVDIFLTNDGMKIHIVRK